MIITIITAFVSFASTNIDDIFILMLFFTQVDKVMKRTHIVIGQYLGIGVLTLISIIGALGLSAIPQEYVGLLGLIPIYLGIKEYSNYKKGSNNENIDQQELENGENSKIEETTVVQKDSVITFINPSIIKVFSVTLANGGDNIGIYTPLFTGMNLVDILVTVIIFMILISLWCFIALKLAEHPFVHINIEKYNHIFVPIIFIGLGLFILMENGTISYICKKLF
ncbi:quaternary ammonium transporter [Clostridium beijerinckii]|nr:quaternary ammonium transporter [Clostridium beijerinckii]